MNAADDDSGSRQKQGDQGTTAELAHLHFARRAGRQGTPTMEIIDSFISLCTPYPASPASPRNTKAHSENFDQSAS